MSKERVIVLAVVQQGLTKAEAARRYQVSWRWVHTLVQRYQAGGLDAVEARSRRPHANSRAVDNQLREAIVDLRHSLTDQGLDAGPISIAWHLDRQGLRVPSTSTIRRILHQAGLVRPEPKKRPRASLHRFTADQPNECWQSDFTHWHLLPDPTSTPVEVEILNWLDDHSRLLLSCTAHPRVTGPRVIDTFLTCVNNHGTPASTLTDNGSVYTSRFTHGRNGFEYLLAALGIEQKNGHPNHPQTQGKVERLHQTQKQWLTRQPPAPTLAALQAQLDTFTRIYNTERGHRSLNGATPAQTYQAGVKATPSRAHPAGPHYRVRYDHVDRGGKISLRRAGKMHHLGVGARHASTPVLITLDHDTATVIALTTGEILSTHHIDPDHTYWRNQQQSPGRWPRLDVNDDPTHL